MTDTTSILVHGTFLETLLSYSHPSHPISRVIFTPNNPSYSSVFRSYARNLRHTTSTSRKPLLIITATHESHVQAAVFSAQKHNLQMKIRSGGHDYEGVSYVSDVPFFILDMFNLRSINIDMGSETAWVGSGATLGELYHTIAANSPTHAFPGGICPTVCVGGHLSGGGYGNMMRKHGLSVDHVIDARLVDARGRVLDRASMGEDMFWAVRGGGGASFAVILAYKIRLVRVPETVTVFQIQRPTDTVHKWQHVAPNLDNNLFLRLTLDVDVEKKTVRASFMSLFLGDAETLISIMNQSFPELGLTRPDCIEVSWIRSVIFFTNNPVHTPLSFLLDRRASISKHTFFKRKSDYVKEAINKENWQSIFNKLIELEEATMCMNPYGGRMSEIPAAETPVPHRAGTLWKTLYATTWNEQGAASTERYVGMLRELYEHMTPYVSKNPRGAYFNYKDNDLGVNRNLKSRSSNFWEGMGYGVKYFNGNFQRLVEVKTRVDPGNFFRNEQSIPTLPLGRL